MAYDFGAAKITYTGGFRDVDMTGYQPLNGFVPETFSFDNNLKYQTQSHELRINGESTALIWQAGIFNGNEDQDVARGLFLPSAKGAFGGQIPFLNYFLRTINSKTTGIFAQATYTDIDRHVAHFAKHGAQEPAHYRPKPCGPPGAAVAA